MTKGIASQAEEIVDSFLCGNRKDAVQKVFDMLAEDPEGGVLLSSYITHYMPDDDVGLWLRLLEKGCRDSKDKG